MYFASAARFSLVLLLVSLCLAKDRPDVSIEEPGPGMAYKAGGVVNAQWTSDQPIVSPSFKICQASGNARRAYRGASMRARVPRRNDDTCGTGIWPEAQQTDSGSYRASFQLPNDLASQSYYLEMEDDFGRVAQSPVFSVSPPQGASNDTDASNAAASTKYEGATSVATPDQATSAEATPNAQAQTTGSSQSAQAPLPSASGGSSEQGNSTTKYSPKSPVYVDSSKLLSSGRPTPVAAYAIPLSAAAAALLIAGGLAIRHRGALLKERDKGERTIQLLEKLSRSSTLSSQPTSGTGDAKLSSMAPQLPHPIQLQPIPLFMPMPVSSSPSSSIQQPPSLFGGHYTASGEPRQITRKAYAYQSPIAVAVDRSASGRPHSHSLSGGRSTPSLPSRSARIRNLSTSSTCFSPSPTVTSEFGIARGIRDNSSAPYLPPLSFSNSLSRASFASSHLSRANNPPYTTSMSKDPSVASDGCTTSEVLEHYCPSPRMDSDSRARLDPTRPSYTHYPVERPLPPSLISAPQRLYIRNEAPTDASFIPPGGNRHPADLFPHIGPGSTYTYRGQEDVYAAVASLLNKSCP